MSSADGKPGICLFDGIPFEGDKGRLGMLKDAVGEQDVVYPQRFVRGRCRIFELSDDKDRKAYEDLCTRVARGWCQHDTCNIVRIEGTTQWQAMVTWAEFYMAFPDDEIKTWGHNYATQEKPEQPFELVGPVSAEQSEEVQGSGTDG